MTAQPDYLATDAPLYSLKLSAAQRSILDWLETEGGLFAHVHVSVDAIAHDLEVGPSTVYEGLARLVALNLLIGNDVGAYRINARYYFAMNPQVRALVAAALADPPITPDHRAQQPRKMGNVESKRRRTIKSVPSE
ncbi:MarR family transcriptional regulator [Streptomyces sp. NPDC006656]|uniref:MarR family transcriptional regulator n=1 Tax=Streptomyces sp. NPDC006656 TaxID=3156899 RepID=UPI003454DBBB